MAADLPFSWLGDWDTLREPRLSRRQVLISK
jgi:hypothetical protein